MLHLVNGAMYANRLGRAGKRLVERCFLHIAAEPIDSLESSGGIDGKQIRSKADVRSVLLVRTVKSEMSGALVGVVR
jgi:hypothetical protein